MILIAMPFNSNDGKTGNGGDAPRIFFGTTSFKSKESALFTIKKALQKGHFHSFAEKGSGPDPQNSPSCAPESMTLHSILHEDERHKTLILKVEILS